MTVRILRMLVFSALQVRHTSCTACVVYIHTYLEDVRLFVHLLLVILICVVKCTDSNLTSFLIRYYTYTNTRFRLL